LIFKFKDKKIEKGTKRKESRDKNPKEKNSTTNGKP